MYVQLYYYKYIDFHLVSEILKNYDKWASQITIVEKRMEDVLIAENQIYK